MKKLLAIALVFTLGACASSSDEQRETASSDGAYHYMPVGVDR